ncbi:hypothetical protein N7539_002161 [Penicillium diatomitis]|uniref:Myb-like DNA-binding domain-containing protein n=1 Tax=Penicillium diatomitis TaxID=2819901 RepID=A0A9W9XIZ7_9EURO|nr:uncharacterized protein N7539_002161 [Penicillium diatomitis]KAJ5493415.1 hypothetical protein N7539_002161 [Penicillium diatomitis]
MASKKAGPSKACAGLTEPKDLSKDNAWFMINLIKHTEAARLDKVHNVSFSPQAQRVHTLHLWLLVENARFSNDANRCLELQIDWDAFYKDMCISTKGAAQKRFERLMSSYGLTTAFKRKQDPSAEEPSDGGSTSLTPSPSKKRKRAAQSSKIIKEDKGFVTNDKEE